MNTPHAPLQILRHQLYPSAILFAILLAATVLTACTKVSTATPQDKRPVVQVAELASPQAISIVATGTVKRQREMALSFRIPGVITQLSVDDADVIKVGQVIAAIDPTAVNARAVQTLTDLERAKRDVARSESLVKAGFVSQESLENQRSALANAVATHDNAEFDKRSSKLVSPISGVVLTRVAQAGEVVQPGQVIVNVADARSPLVLRLPLADKDAAKVRVGDRCRVNFAAFSDQDFDGAITRIGERVGAQTGTIQVEVSLPQVQSLPRQLQPELRSGLIGRATIALTQNNKSPASAKSEPAAAYARVPAEAVLEASGRNASVYVIAATAAAVGTGPSEVANGKTSSGTMARRVPVVFGGFDGDDALISGLAPGSNVITSGAGYVLDGQQVRVIDAKSLKRELESSLSTSTATGSSKP
jgi:membrane fusion protein, multidrug efflux system